MFNLTDQQWRDLIFGGLALGILYAIYEVQRLLRDIAAKLDFIARLLDQPRF